MIPASQLWTLVFLTVLALLFGLAAWQDRGDAKRREQRNAAVHKKDETGN
jgi:hypothetical protein